MSSALEATQRGISEPTPPLLPTRESLHLRYLDGLRALAALFVVVHHARMMTEPVGIVAILTEVFGYGHFAVSLFIVLSGFCLMLPIARGDGTLRGGALHFFKKRARRILPPYYGALALSLALYWVHLRIFGSLPPDAQAVTAKGVVTHLLLVHNVWADTINQINGPMWSIAVEWQIYFLFPVFVLCWRQFGGLQTALTTLVVGYAALYALNHTLYAGITPHYLGLFTLGMLSATIAFSPQANWRAWREKVPWHWVTVGLVFALYLACFQVFKPPTPLLTLDVLVGLFAMSLLVAASREGANPLRALLSWKPLAFLGTFSYSIYLVHMPLLQMLFRCGCLPLHLSMAADFLLLVFVGTPLILGIAYLFFLCCERPFLNQPRQDKSQATGSQ